MLPVDHLPPLPALDGDLVLVVYTDDSLPPPVDGLQDAYGDRRRLATIGEVALRMAVTKHFYDKRPMLNAHEVESEVQMILSDESPRITEWLDMYGLRQRLSVNPEHRDEIFASRPAMKRFFSVYVGAVYHLKGLSAVEKWISGIIDPSSYVKEEDQETNIPPQPVSTPPPPPPGYSISPMGSPLAGTSVISLGAMNELGQKYRVAITYTGKSTGPPHQPTWTVQCLIDGKVYGEGVGPNQKEAKKVAIQHAYANYPWSSA